MTVSNTQENFSAVSPQPRASNAEVSSDLALEARIRACSTVVSMLQLRAQLLPDQVMLTFVGDEGEPEEPVTAAELDMSARRVAVLLQSLGAVNQRVLLAMQPGRLYCTAFWGCLYAHAQAVPVYPPISPALAERVQTIAQDCGATLVLTDRLINAVGAGLHNYAPQLRELKWIELEDLQTGTESQWSDPGLVPDDLAFLQYTSGTTGDPKGVMITHENLTSNLRSLGRVAERDLKVGTEHGLNRGFSWLPPFHDMGLTGMLLPVATGSHLVTCSPMIFIRRPERWVREISKWGANVSGGPNFAYELLVERAPQLEGEDLDLSQWKVAVSGAEHVKAATLDRFCATYEKYGFRREFFCPSYGMAEATLYITSANESREPLVCYVDKEAFARGDIVVRERGDATTLDFVGCGSSTDLTVVVVDLETMTEAAPGKIGEIWAKGPNIGHGYWNKPELTQERFGAMLTDARTGLPRGPYMRTGDNGFWHGGQLFIAGRIKELLSVAGRTFYPGDLEQTACAASDALTPRGGAMFTLNDASGERVVLVHEAQERSTKAAEIAPAIAQALLQEHAIALSELVLIRKNSLLRTSSGKQRRVSVREAFSEGRLKILSAWKANA